MTNYNQLIEQVARIAEERALLFNSILNNANVQQEYADKFDVIYNSVSLETKDELNITIKDLRDSGLRMRACKAMAFWGLQHQIT